MGRYLADQSPRPATSSWRGRPSPWFGDADAAVGEIEEFLTGSRRLHDADRVLATVLFTDIVGSTEQAAKLGDHRWRELLDDHDRLVRRELGRFRGREVKTTGDGFLATFDGPARGIRCAAAIRDGTATDGPSDSGPVCTPARSRCAATMSAAWQSTSGPGGGDRRRWRGAGVETVKDLVVGAGIGFADRGEHDLKGVPARGGSSASAATG